MKKKLKDKTTSSVPGTILIIVAMIVVFGLVFGWMYSVDLLFLPNFIKEMLGLSEVGDPVEWSVDELQSAVKNGKDPEGKTIAFDVTYENLRRAFLECPEPEGEYVDAEISYFIDAEPVKRRICYYRNGEQFRTEMYSFREPDKLETVIIGDGSKVSRISADGEVTSTPASEDILFEEESGIPSIDRLIALVESFPESKSPSVESDAFETDNAANVETYGTSAITDADISDVDYCELKLVQSDAGNVYYVAFTYPALGIREEYYLSLDYCMIIFMQSQKDGKVYYSYEAKRISHNDEAYSEISLYSSSEASKQK